MSSLPVCAALLISDEATPELIAVRERLDAISSGDRPKRDDETWAQYRAYLAANPPAGLKRCLRPEPDAAARFIATEYARPIADEASDEPIDPHRVAALVAFAEAATAPARPPRKAPALSAPYRDAAE